MTSNGDVTIMPPTATAAANAPLPNEASVATSPVIVFPYDGPLAAPQYVLFMWNDQPLLYERHKEEA